MEERALLRLRHPSVFHPTVESLPLRSHRLFLRGGVQMIAHGATGTIGSHVIFQQRPQQFLDVIFATQVHAPLVLHPRSLIFAIPALHLLMLTRCDLLLECLRPSGFDHTSHLEDLGSIEPRVGATLHNRDTVDLHFVDMDIGINSLATGRVSFESSLVNQELVTTRRRDTDPIDLRSKLIRIRNHRPIPIHFLEPTHATPGAMRHTVGICERHGRLLRHLGRRGCGSGRGSHRLRSVERAHLRLREGHPVGGADTTLGV